MAFDNQQGPRPEKQMYPVDAKCMDCGKEIKQVPFPPDPARLDKIKCYDCHRASKGSFRKDSF